MIGRVLDLSLKIRHYQAPLQYALLAYDHHNSTWVVVIAPSKQDCTIFLTDKSNDNAGLELP
jgi:hypothetical protein